MKRTPSPLIKKIYDQVQRLPEESLTDLTRYLEFLLFASQKTPPPEPTPERPLKIIRLGGILKGYEVSREQLKQARQDMWHSLADLGE